MGVRYIIQQIEKLVREQKYSYQDFTILYRNNILGHFLEKNSIAFNIPYVVLVGVSFYQNKVIKDFLAYLYVLPLNPLQDFLS